MEAEYIAACEAAKESVWLKKFYTHLEVVPNMKKPLVLYCDNSGAVAISEEPRSHKRGYHLERKYYLIREIVHRGDVVVIWGRNTPLVSQHGWLPSGALSVATWKLMLRHGWQSGRSRHGFGYVT